MPKLTIGLEFFRNEMHNVYSDFPTSFWRENLQNSVDSIAKSGRTHSGLISITTAPGRNDPANILITITDNGVGMTRDVIENVFMKLGETTKATDGNQKGGFGRARLMTHFAQSAYEINTRDLRVVGVADSWEFVDPTHFQEGCQMIIEVIPKTRWGYDLDMMGALTQYLNLCQLPCEVIVNGVRHESWTHRRSALKSLSFNGTPFGTVHVNKSAISKDADGGKMLVRVDGTLMFERHIKPKLQIIFEIDASLSRQVLQVSRDSLHHDYRRVVDEFIDELNTETRSALRKEERESRPISGTGSFVAYRKKATAELTTDSHQRINMENSVLPSSIYVNISTAAHASIERTDSIFESDKIVIDEQARNSMFDILIFSDLGEMDDAQKKIVRSAIPSYNPLNWKVNTQKSLVSASNPTGAFFTGGQKAKLLLIWKTICFHVVQEALELFDMDRISWGVGWNFDSDEAKHHAYEDINYLLVNPVDIAGKMKYELRDSDHLDNLYAMAIHEVTHIKFRRHDEDFASAITQLMARCQKRLPAIKKGIKDVYKVKMT